MRMGISWVLKELRHQLEKNVGTGYCLQL